MMKTLIPILGVLILCTTFVKAQKFSTQAGYEKYFIDNYKKLDQIEGIWQKVIEAKMVGSDQPIGERAKITVAIISEGNDYSGNKIFGEYYLVNGKYDPTGSKGKFIKFNDNPNKYLFKDNGGGNNVDISCTPFYLGYKEANFNYELTMSGKGSASLIMKIELFKSFPFEGDVLQ